MMTPLDYYTLSPWLTLFFTAALILILEAFFPRFKRTISLITITGLIVTLMLSSSVPASTHPMLQPWLVFDDTARFFSAFFLVTGLSIAFMAASFFTAFQQNRSEFYFFLLSGVFGLMLVAYANDFLTLFLGVETLSLALYVMCSYAKKWTRSQEAAFKYFLQGSIATAFLLFGIALVYGACGTTCFSQLQNTAPENSFLFYSGIALISMSLLFKAAIVPFHIWAPDVYAGAPSPVTAFMAVGTKAGAFAALIRLFIFTFTNISPMWQELMALLVYPTLIYANFVALRQTNMRRFFAYSGISHAGFLLMGLVTKDTFSLNAMLFYLVVYAVATLIAFTIIGLLDDKEEGVGFTDLKGLYFRSPILASLFSLSLLTLAGVPPTVGFFAKLYILQAAFKAGYIALVVTGLLTAILAAYYYLRIIAELFTKTEEVAAPIPKRPSRPVSIVLASALIVLSCYPEPLVALIKRV